MVILTGVQACSLVLQFSVTIKQICLTLEHVHSDANKNTTWHILWV